MRASAHPARSTTLADELAGIRHGDLAAALRHDLTSYNGPSICFGIMLAGAAYPVIMAAIFLVGFLGFIAVNLAHASLGPDAIELVAVPFFVAGYAAFAAVLGWMWIGVLAMITLPVAYAVVRSLKLHGSLVSLGAVLGGLVGFIAVLPLTLCLPWIMGPGDFWVLIIALPLGPGLASVLGQVGGAWGGWRAWQSTEQFYGLAVSRASTAVEPSSTAPATGETQLTEPNRSDCRLQFGLRHMMWLIVWLSVLLSIIRLSGIPFSYAIPLLVGWTIYQWFTLRIGRRLTERLGPWWTARRARRST